MNPVEVSIIIPCYNYARFLPDAVRSVVAQTFQSWEIIIVDDGSNDDTIDIARRLMAQYPDRRIRLFHQPNQGLAATRNTGASYAAGEYVLFLDADDMLAPTLLERTTAVLREHPAVGFVYTGMRLFGRDEHDWPSVAYNRRILALEDYVLVHSLVRRSAWEQVGGFDTVHFPDSFEDWDFWLRLGAAGWQGWHVNELLVLYRRHGESMTDRFRPELKWNAFAQLIRKHPDLYGPRLVAWATVRCARRGLPGAGAPQREVAAEQVRELGPLERPPAGEAGVTRAGEQQPTTPLWRRLIWKVPFPLRFRLKCWRRRGQLGLRAALPWRYL
jgi:glycosyltransferase involved in cell wall biosynthesis